MEKTLLATGIVILSFITIAFAHAKQKQAPVKKAEAAENSITGAPQDTAAVANMAEDVKAPENFDDTTKHKKRDSTFSNYNSHTDGNHSTINTTYQGREYRIVQDDDTLTELFVDGEKIPHDKIAEYQPVIDKVNEQRKQFVIQQEQFRKQREQFRRQQEVFRDQQEQFRLQRDTLREGIYAQQKEQWRKQQEQFRLQRDSLRTDEFRLQQEQFRQQQEMFRKQQEQFREQQREFREQQRRFRDSGDAFLEPPFDPIAPMAPVDPIAPAEIMSPMAPMPPPAPMAPIAPVAPAAPLENKTIKAIASELKAAGVITDTKNLSFSLTSGMLTVNGEKQPDALFEKMKKEFLKSDKDHVIYESYNNGHSTHASIAIDSK